MLCSTSRMNPNPRFSSRVRSLNNFSGMGPSMQVSDPGITSKSGRDSSKRSSVVVATSDVRDADVLSGRGKRFVKHWGNLRFDGKQMDAGRQAGFVSANCLETAETTENLKS
jgi:hypothetical protein